MRLHDWVETMINVTKGCNIQEINGKKLIKKAMLFVISINKIRCSINDVLRQLIFQNIFSFAAKQSFLGIKCLKIFHTKELLRSFQTIR